VHLNKSLPDAALEVGIDETERDAKVGGDVPLGPVAVAAMVKVWLVPQAKEPLLLPAPIHQM